MIKVKIDTSLDAILYHDIEGNLYLNFSDGFYFFNINGKNELEVAKIKNPSILNKIACNKTGKILCLTSGNKLKAKIIDKIIDETDLEQDENGNIGEKADDDYLKYQMYPEDKYYDKEDCSSEASTVSSKSDADDYCNFIHESRYIFYGECDRIENSLFEENTLYDTVVLSGNYNSSHVVFKTELKGDSPTYRLNIYTDGFIMLNIVGSERKLYKFEVENNLLSCKYLKSRYAVESGSKIQWI